MSMKNKAYVLNTVLAAVVGLVMLALVLMRTFLPQYILPRVSIPNLMLVSLAALLVDHCIAGKTPRCYVCTAVFAALTFGLLPWAAGYISAGAIWKLALGGGIVFTAATWLYTLACDRLSSGPASKAAPIISAVGLYLAAQCFAGIIF